MTQAAWKSPFISLLYLSYRACGQGLEMASGGQVSCVCFLLWCSIAHNNTICRLLVHSAFKIPVWGVWQVKDSSFVLGGWLCSLVHPNASVGPEIHCKGNGTGRSKRAVTCAVLFFFLTQYVPSLSLAGDVLR